MPVALLPHVFGPDAEFALEAAFGANLAADPAGWTWTDITADVRADPGITWQFGRADESSASNPGALTAVLNNTTGAYSVGPGPRYPYIRRGVPIRLRMDPDGAGMRIAWQGYADGWSPGWDSLRGTISHVTLSASGSLRRLAQGTAPVISPLRRTLIKTSSVKGYWPMEDGAAADVLLPQIGTAYMKRSGPMTLASNDTFACSAPLPVLDGGSDLDVLVDTYPNTGEHQVRWLMQVPSGLLNGAVLAAVHTSGTIARWEWVYSTTSGGCYQLWAYNIDGSVFMNTSLVDFDADGTSVRASLELVQSGGNINWQFGVTGVSIAATSAGYYSGVALARTVGTISRVQLNPYGHAHKITYGHLTVQNDQTSLYEANSPLTAYNGEYITGGSGRLVRLCTEHGLPLLLFGTGEIVNTVLDRMGPQDRAPLIPLLRQCEDAERGQLWDGLSPGLAYTTRRYHETPSIAPLIIDAAAGELAAPFDAPHDDQRTCNRATVTRTDGGTATFADVTGPLGTDAIGAFDDSLSVNAFSDGSLFDLAAWLVHRGTTPGYRYPAVAVDLVKSPHLATAALIPMPGARIDVTHLDDALSGMGPDTLALTVEGISHTLTAMTWRAQWTCSPYESWRVATLAATTGDAGATLGRLDVDTATVATNAAAGATSLQVATAAAPRWTTVADDYPFDLDVGGVRVSVTACAGSGTPQTFTCAPLSRAIAAGAPVRLWQPTALGL